MTETTRLCLYQPGMAQTFLGPRGFSRYYGGAERQMDIISQLLVERYDFEAAVLIYADDWTSGWADGRYYISAQLPPHMTEDPVDMASNPIKVELALELSGGDIFIQRGGGLYSYLVAHYAHTHRGKYVYSVSHTGELFPDRLKMSTPSRMSLMKALREADVVVCQTREQLEMAQDMGLSATMIKNIILLPPSEIDSSHMEPRAIWLSHMRPWKHPERFIDLAAAMPDHKFLMFCADELNVKLKRRAFSLSNLELRNYISNAATEINSGDVIVNTSDHEGLPNAFLEGWSRGASVLSTERDHGGIIGESGAGIVGGASELREMLEGKSIKLGRKGREYVYRTYSPDIILPKWNKLLKEIL